MNAPTLMSARPRRDSIQESHTGSDAATKWGSPASVEPTKAYSTSAS